MSAIDTFKHRCHGLLCGVPVYQLKEEYPGNEFKATTQDLILGGGSGEHESFTVPAEYAAQAFLDLILEGSWEREPSAWAPRPPCEQLLTQLLLR